MFFRVLSDVGVTVSDTRYAISAGRQRALLCVLALASNREVGRGTITLDSGDGRLNRGQLFGLVWEGGSGIIGDIVREEHDGVDRAGHLWGWIRTWMARSMFGAGASGFSPIETRMRAVLPSEYGSHKS